MNCRFTDLRCKEVINICDGCRLGYVGDVECQLPEGQMTALIVPGPCRFLGLFGRSAFSACSAAARNIISRGTASDKWGTTSFWSISRSRSASRRAANGAHAVGVYDAQDEFFIIKKMLRNARAGCGK